ncbi:MAG TPA: hypothetical protein VH914_08505 [Acidimicrobiia bacterium]|nr:hypothetical protein [Acidimicrobiia bacterium]
MSALAVALLILGLTGIARATNAAAASTTNITLDGPAVVVRLTTAGQPSQLKFAGTAGQSVSAVLSHSTVGAACPAIAVALLRPDSSQLGFGASVCGANGFLDTHTLDATGTWTIVLTPQGSDTGHVTVRALSVTDQVGTIVRNAIPVAVHITTPGQNARFTFSSNTGQQISAILSGSTFGTACDAVEVVLVRPDGTTFGSAAPSCKDTAFLDGQTLDASGNWTMVVDPQGAGVGNANLAAYNANDVTGLTKDDGSVFAVPAMNPGQNSTVHINGSNGQKISALVTKANYPQCFQLSLRRPDNSAFGNVVKSCTKSDFLDAQTLDQNGIWSIVVDPLGTSVGTSKLQVWDASDATKAITLNGAPISATLDPGQKGEYTFTGTAGQQVSATVTGATIKGCPGYAINLLRPNGSVFASANGCNDKAFLDSQTLDTAGPWTLEIDPVGSASGDLTLNGWTFADDDGTADLSGKPAFLDFTRPGQNAVWSFHGTNHQKVSAYVTDADLQGCDFTLTLLRPNGSVFGSPVDSCTDTAFLEPQVLDQTGTWTVRVDPTGTNQGEATLQVFDIVDESQPFKPGPDIRTFTSEAPGTNAAYHINGKTGDVRTVTITGSTYDAGACPAVVVTLRRPDGSTLTSQSTCSNTLTIANVTLDANGSWTLFVDPQGPATGTMVIRLK